MSRSIEQRYFSWLCNLVCDNQFYKFRDYTKLLKTLYSREFYWKIPLDSNRASDGCELRRRFAYENRFGDDDIADMLRSPCTVLEMMVGLAVRCEDEIMHDDYIGDRTSTWFWGMIENMGLVQMNDQFYEKYEVNDRITDMLERHYHPSGLGGLFKVYLNKCDMRDVEIWYQMQYYLVEAYPI